MKSDPQIRTAIIAKIRQNDSGARTHRRYRFPQQNRLDEWAKLFRADDDKLNCYMIRRLRRAPTMKGIPNRLAKIEHTYEIRFYYGLLDSDDDSEASEEIAWALIDSLAAILEADASLGLGATVTHNGLELPTDFEDVVIGDWPAHRALLRLSVVAQNVNCA